ncbi:MAG: hypothetical protein A2152_02400 [Candidatus Levybacteria bacterium RBG_16_35_6]|nr:MAG: hypothetical protein A2152_02400 [Candidatus Levybacteria bacterium RBG_16_35_6]
MSLLRTAKAEVLSPGFFVNSALFSLVYALLFVFISNHKLFTYSIDHYGIYTTYKLLLNGVLGLPNSLSRLDLVFFVITSILVGLNFALIIKTLDRLKGQKIRLSVGGGAVLALVATGCSACGLSIISLFGLSAATFAFLPFKGVEFNLAAVVILLFTFLYTLQKFDYVCQIKS